MMSHEIGEKGKAEENFDCFGIAFDFYSQWGGCFREDCLSAIKIRREVIKGTEDWMSVLGFDSSGFGVTRSQL